jgi:2-amino-4-hydroxy-6-hydroxymethyldihydropteridine diphosphokinase
LDCDLEAEVLLNHLQQIESRALRQRLVANGPRTLDLDLIAVDDLVMHSRSLELPHPRAAKRRFVLEPWFEVEPEAEIPGVGKVAELLKQVSDQGVAKLERLQLL